MDQADVMARIDALHRLRANGYSYSEIASELGISPYTLRDFRKLHDVESALWKKCEMCSNEYLANRASQRYCSNECRQLAVQGIEQSHLTQCLQCGEYFHSSRKGVKYCGTACRKKADKAKRKADRRTKLAAMTQECKWCGKTFTLLDRSSDYCSRYCSKSAYNSKFIHHGSPEDRLKECTKVDRRVTLPILIKRDHNICQICGKPCDLYDYDFTENGVMFPGEDYPTIDHIFPVSKGGSHTWDNVQLAHKCCNRKKSTDVTVTSRPTPMP